MKFSVVNAVVLLLLIVLTGVFYMKKSKEIAVVNIDAIYNQSAAGDMVRKHLNEVKSILEKGYEDAQKAFADNANKEALLLDARQKLERQCVIEENSAKMVLSRAIDNAIGTWRKDNPKILLYCLQVLCLRITSQLISPKKSWLWLKKKIWFLISYPKWKCTIRMKRNQNKVSNH